MHKNQKGFTVVEGLLVFIIVGLVAFVGYFVYHSQQETNKTLTNVQNNSSPVSPAKKSTASSTKSTASSTSKTTATADTQKYLTITEWGVKFTEISDSEDASYRFSDASNQQFLGLKSADFNNVIGNHGETCMQLYSSNGGEDIAYLGRYKNDDPNLQDLSYTGPLVSKKMVGDYTYTLSTKKQYYSDCLMDKDGNPSQANGDLFTKKSSSYIKMFSTIQAI